MQYTGIGVASFLKKHILSVEMAMSMQAGYRRKAVTMKLESLVHRVVPGLKLCICMYNV